MQLSWISAPISNPSLVLLYVTQLQFTKLDVSGTLSQVSCQFHRWVRRCLFMTPPELHHTRGKPVHRIRCAWRQLNTSIADDLHTIQRRHRCPSVPSNTPKSLDDQILYIKRCNIGRKIYADPSLSFQSLADY